MRRIAPDRPTEAARRPLLPPAVAVVAILAAAVSGDAGAATLNCRPNWDFAVEVDGAYPQDACFYRSDAPRKLFVNVPAMKTGLLLDLEARRVTAIPRGQIATVDGGLTVQDGVPPGSRAYAFSVEGPIIQFKAEDRKVRILPALLRQPLVGPVEFDRLLADRAEYREGMKAYTPDPKAIETIRRYGKDVQIEAFFGTWCRHCKEHMPKFLRVMQEARNPRIRLTLVGLPREFGTQPGPWQGKNITAIPAIIVKIDGKEITRLGSHPGSLPEAELAGIFDAVR